MAVATVPGLHFLRGQRGDRAAGFGSLAVVATGALLTADSFDRGDGALGNTDGAGTLDPLAWSQVSPTGELEIRSGKMEHTGALPSPAEVQWAAVDLGRGDARVAGSLTLSATQAHAVVVGRATDIQNALVVQFAKYGSTDRIDVYKEVADSVTVLATKNSAGLALGQTYAVDVSFDSRDVVVRLDGTVQVSHTLSAADFATFDGVTRFGLGFAVQSTATNDDGTSTWDNFSARAA